MQVGIVDFPEIKVAVAEHRGPPELEYESSRKLTSWRLDNGLSPETSQTYGIHYTDPFTVQPENHRVDFCVSYDRHVGKNVYGILAKIIPTNKCALARHFGSRSLNTAAICLLREWLPTSGFIVAEFPIIFQYVNVGPNVKEADMITDVYLPIRKP